MDANNRLAVLYKDPDGTKDKVLDRIWEKPNFSCCTIHREIFIVAGGGEPHFAFMEK